MGVIVRIERKGLIGRIDFNSRFMHTIASTPMGTSLTNLSGTVPEMEISEDSTASGVHVSARNSCRKAPFFAGITFDVSGIAIFNPDAE
ncbi:UNVERIFIED_ORG: hypothetical protein M2312_000381 [Rhizobium esperanzae]|uniref:DUF7256 domain-containing protein n=1 Tax=Rhizobium etli (strain CIAT 652) TaxID=491916 RepID=B3Q477_RHIE6|nr:hypothetical protein RHECIAT_PC0000808 [Rhizobium etli CIAT 652]EGE60876.1 hypothetical protein RHECNPAF_1330047 [Rhizobium etli CNPAF512]MDH6645751.1 hypothetical protein [Rhizobium esperanzae]